MESDVLGYARPIETTELRTDAARSLFAAWKTWRGDALLPSRADMRLSDIVALLPMISVLEIRSPQEIVFRLAGTAITAAVGFELKGMNYLEMTKPEIRPHRSARLLSLARQPCGGLAHNVRAVDDGGSAGIEIMVLPIRPAENDGALQLLSISALTDPGVMLGGDIKAQLDKVADQFSYLDVGAGVPDGYAQKFDALAS